MHSYEVPLTHGAGSTTELMLDTESLEAWLALTPRALKVEPMSAVSCLISSISSACVSSAA